MGRLGRALQLLGLGWYIAFCLVLGIGAGVWLDQQTGLAPLFLLIGLALGLGLAFYGTLRMVSQAVDEETGEP